MQTLTQIVLSQQIRGSQHISSGFTPSIVVFEVDFILVYLCRWLVFVYLSSGMAASFVVCSLRKPFRWSDGDRDTSANHKYT